MSSSNAADEKRFAEMVALLQRQFVYVSEREVTEALWDTRDFGDAFQILNERNSLRSKSARTRKQLETAPRAQLSARDQERKAAVNQLIEQLPRGEVQQIVDHNKGDMMASAHELLELSLRRGQPASSAAGDECEQGTRLASLRSTDVHGPSYVQGDHGHTAATTDADEAELLRRAALESLQMQDGWEAGPAPHVAPRAVPEAAPPERRTHKHTAAVTDADEAELLRRATQASLESHAGGDARLTPAHAPQPSPPSPTVQHGHTVATSDQEENERISIALKISQLYEERKRTEEEQREALIDGLKNNFPLQQQHVEGVLKEVEWDKKAAIRKLLKLDLDNKAGILKENLPETSVEDIERALIQAGADVAVALQMLQDAQKQREEAELRRALEREQAEEQAKLREEERRKREEEERRKKLQEEEEEEARRQEEVRRRKEEEMALKKEEERRKKEEAQKEEERRAEEEEEAERRKEEEEKQRREEEEEEEEKRRKAEEEEREKVADEEAKRRQEGERRKAQEEEEGRMAEEKMEGEEEKEREERAWKGKEEMVEDILKDVESNVLPTPDVVQDFAAALYELTAPEKEAETAGLPVAVTLSHSHADVGAEVAITAACEPNMHVSLTHVLVLRDVHGVQKTVEISPTGGTVCYEGKYVASQMGTFTVDYVGDHGILMGRSAPLHVGPLYVMTAAVHPEDASKVAVDVALRGDAAQAVPCSELFVEMFPSSHARDRVGAPQPLVAHNSRLEFEVPLSTLRPEWHFKLFHQPPAGLLSWMWAPAAVALASCTIRTPGISPYIYCKAQEKGLSFSALVAPAEGKGVLWYGLFNAGSPGPLRHVKVPPSKVDGDLVSLSDLFSPLPPDTYFVKVMQGTEPVLQSDDVVVE